MREVVGQLHEVGALRYFDEVEARFHETQAAEAAAEENYKDRQPAADARREAKREWLRMAGAQDWLEGNQVGENSSLVTPEMTFKSVDQTRQAAYSYGDTRKWAVGTRAAREGLASARMALRVVEELRPRDGPPGSAEALRMVLRMALEQEQKKLDAALTARLRARLGLGHIVALCHRSSTSYQTH